ncbi:unnamed protein product, partial [Diplocarpon coronariae]
FAQKKNAGATSTTVSSTSTSTG